MHIQKIIYLLIFILLSSCSYFGTKQDNDSYIGVSIDESNNNNLPTIEEIENSEKDPQYSTKDNNNSSQRKNHLKLPVITVVLSEAFNLSFLYMEILKQFEQSEIPIHVITGHGTSAILASSYAFNLKANILEWKYFQYTKKKEPFLFYSKDWFQQLQKYFIKENSAKNIQQSKITLLLPALSKRPNYVDYHSLGQIEKHLNDSNNLMNKVFKSDNIQFNNRVFLKLGTDLLIFVQLVDKKNIHQNDISKTITSGDYKKYLSKIFHPNDSNRKIKILLFNINVKNLNLTQEHNLDDLLFTYKDAINARVKSLKKYIYDWQNNANQSDDLQIIELKDY